MKGQIMSGCSLTKKDLVAIGLVLVSAVVMAQGMTVSDSFDFGAGKQVENVLVKKVRAESAAATITVEGQENSYSSLQDAVTAAKSTDNKTVHISAGTLTLTDVVTVPTGVEVIGEGVDQTFINASEENFAVRDINSYGYLFEVNPGATLSQMTLTGLKKGYKTDGSAQGVHVAGTSTGETNTILSNLKIQNSGKHGINVFQVSDAVKIQNVTITGSDGSGVNVNASGNVVAEKLVIEDSEFDAAVGIDNNNNANAGFVWKSGSYTLKTNTNEKTYYPIGIDANVNNYTAQYTIGDTSGNFITRAKNNVKAEDRFSHADYFLGMAVPEVADVYALAGQDETTAINYYFDGVQVTKVDDNPVIYASGKTVSEMATFSAALKASEAETGVPVTVAHKDGETMVTDYTVIASYDTDTTQVTTAAVTIADNSSVTMADVLANMGTLTSVTVTKGTATATAYAQKQESSVAAVMAKGDTYYASTFYDAFGIAKGETATIQLLSGLTINADNRGSTNHAYSVTDMNLTLDLNGKTLTYDDKNHTGANVFMISQNGQLKVTSTATDSKGNVIKGKIVDTQDSAVNQVFRLHGSNDASATNYAVLEIDENVEVDSYALYGAVVFRNAENPQPQSYGVKVSLDGSITLNKAGSGKGHETAVFFILGTIQNQDGAPQVIIGEHAQLRDNAGDWSLGLGLMGYGNTTIADGAVVEGHDTAVEVRAGRLTINGGVFASTKSAQDLAIFSNGSGNTVKGAALAVVQHNTYLPTNVVINGGSFNGYLPLVEYNAIGSSADDLAKVSIDVKGGAFTSTNNSESLTMSFDGNTVEGQSAAAVYSQNKQKFLTGGTYSISPAASYIADSYVSYANGDGTYTVMQTYGSLSAAIAGLAADTSDNDLPAVQVVTTDEYSLENGVQVSRENGYYRVVASEASMSGALVMANSLIGTNPTAVTQTTIAYGQQDGNTVSVQAVTGQSSKREIQVNIDSASTQSLPGVSDAWHMAAADQINDAVSVVGFNKGSEAVTVYLDKKKVVTQVSEPTLTTALAQYQAAATSEAQVAVDYYRTQPNDNNGNTVTHFVSLTADGDQIKAEMNASTLAEAMAAYETLSSEQRALISLTCTDSQNDGLTYQIATGSNGKVTVTDTTSAAADDIGSVFASFIKIGQNLGTDIQQQVQIVDAEGKFTILLMPQACSDTTYCSDDFAGQVLVMTSGTPAAAQALIKQIQAANSDASFIMMVSTTNQIADASWTRWWSFIRPVQAAEASYYGVEVVSGQTQAVLVTAVDSQTDTYLQTHGTTSVKLIEDNSQTATQVNLVSAHEDQEVVKAALEAFQTSVSTANATLMGKDFTASNDANGKLTSIAFTGDVSLDEAKALVAGTTGSITVSVGGQTYTFVNGQLHVSTPSSPADTSDKGDRHASGDNVPNEARPQGCADVAPAGDVDVFQINRQGSNATIYFAPVPGAHNYHVVFGHQAGDERYGGIAMSADDVSGVLAIDVTNLDPSQQYSFKVAPVNGCAVGSWSNWLTTKGVARYGKTPVKTYRYTGNTK